MAAPFTSTGTRHLRCVEDNHNKFYTITLTEAGVSILYGRIAPGGATDKGTSLVKPFSAFGCAVKEANKLLKQKLAKGYQLHGLTTPTPSPRAPGLDFEPTLAVDYAKAGVDVTGYLASEKLDGIRALWVNGALYTRNGNQIAPPESWTAGLPRDQCLDGEVYLGRGNDNFNAVSGLVRSLNPNHPLWMTATYNVFDAPREPGGIETRLAAVPNALGAFAIKVTMTRLRSPAHMEELKARMLADGAEGLILRAPDVGYVHGRTTTMLKVKEFQTLEATVVGYNWPATRSLALEMPGGQSFSCTVAQDVVDAPPPVGSSVTVKCFELTSNGVPRFPSFVGLRTDLETSPKRRKLE
jgi:DNA ligase 1